MWAGSTVAWEAVSSQMQVDMFCPGCQFNETNTSVGYQTSNGLATCKLI